MQATAGGLRPGYSEFKPWKREKVLACISADSLLNAEHVEWWKRFFDCLPKVSTNCCDSADMSI